MDAAAGQQSQRNGRRRVRARDQEIPPPPSSSQPLFNTRTPYTSPLRQSRLINTPSSSRRSRKANPLEVDVDASSDGSSDIGQIKFEPKGKGKGPPGGDESDESIGVQPSKRRRTVVDSTMRRTNMPPQQLRATPATSKTVRRSGSLALLDAQVTLARGPTIPARERVEMQIQVTRKTCLASTKTVRTSFSCNSRAIVDTLNIEIVSSRLRKKTTKLTARQKLLEKLKSKRAHL